MSEKERGSQQGAAPATDKTKKRGISRFLALLGNCCGVQDNAHPVGEAPEPPKKVTKTKPSQTSLPIPKEAAPAESGTTTSKMTEEPEATAQEPRLYTTQQLNEKPVPSLPMAPVETLNEKALAEKPLPASPPSDATFTAPQLVGAQGFLHDASSGATGSTGTAALSEEDAVISDRTPAQKAIDDDLEVNDAGPHIPLASHEIPSTQDDPITHQGSPITQVDIAPVPSASERQIQPVVLPGPAPIAAIIAREEYVQPTDRKWLLPPVRAEHKRRKCLVLDLDETLVHSSFKVKSPNISLGSQPDCHRCSTTPTSPFPSRLKVNITTFMLSNVPA